MKRTVTLAFLVICFSASAIIDGDVSFWDTSAYVEPQVVSATSSDTVAYDGFVKTAAAKICSFFTTFPTGLMMIFR